MTDFVDISSNNPLPDLHAYKTSGAQLIALKATEGVGYFWPQGDQLADQARAGLTVLRYHFAKPGVPGAAQAAYFLQHCDPADIPCLDLEGSGWAPGEAAQVCKEFTAAIETKRKPGIVYSGVAFLTENRVAYPHGWSVWLAAYGQPSPPAPPAGWPAPWAWQYTDHGTVAGVSAPCDVSHLYGKPDPRQPDPPAHTVGADHQTFPTVQRDTWNSLSRLVNGNTDKADQLWIDNPEVRGEGMRTRVDRGKYDTYLASGQTVHVKFASRPVHR